MCQLPCFPRVKWSILKNIIFRSLQKVSTLFPPSPFEAVIWGNMNDVAGCSGGLISVQASEED